VKITIFEYLKTGNAAFDTIISTIIISCFGYCINYMYENNFNKIISNLTISNMSDGIKDFFYKKNCIIIEGKKCFTTCLFTPANNVTSIYSDRFKAIWSYIITNIENNNSIFQIKESHTNFQSSTHNNEKQKFLDIFMVYQKSHFKIDENIYVITSVEQEETNGDKERITTKTDKITIKIYSYIYSLEYLKTYVDNITNNYLASIKNNRNNKKFIYKLDKITFDSDNESKLDCWREDIFESTRSFNNIFFDKKKVLIEKIDFFLNNRDWYYEKGIPYTLGIGLHGPPGTGKTSFIKALANYTNRHIVEFSLKLIKTKSQLEQFFFENTYNSDNEKGSLTFDKKIIVFEDIDCIGDIILERNRKNKQNKMKIHSENKFVKTNNKIQDVINTICEINETQNTSSNLTNLTNNEPPITLDDILNLWDGIRETPGRILIISSNHYDKLDKALIRPGRIDITHKFSNASHNTISELYSHLFKSNIDTYKLQKIKEYFYSPAELINMYVSYKNEKEFIDRILMNKK
jgi:hypothetical protein